MTLTAKYLKKNMHNWRRSREAAAAEEGSLPLGEPTKKVGNLPDAEEMGEYFTHLLRERYYTNPDDITWKRITCPEELRECVDFDAVEDLDAAAETKRAARSGLIKALFGSEDDEEAKESRKQIQAFFDAFDRGDYNTCRIFVKYVVATGRGSGAQRLRGIVGFLRGHGGVVVGHGKRGDSLPVAAKLLKELDPRNLLMNLENEQPGGGSYLNAVSLPDGFADLEVEKAAKCARLFSTSTRVLENTLSEEQAVAHIDATRSAAEAANNLLRRTVERAEDKVCCVGMWSMRKETLAFNNPATTLTQAYQLWQKMKNSRLGLLEAAKDGSCHSPPKLSGAAVSSRAAHQRGLLSCPSAQPADATGSTVFSETGEHGTQLLGAHTGLAGAFNTGVFDDWDFVGGPLLGSHLDVVDESSIFYDRSDTVNDEDGGFSLCPSKLAAELAVSHAMKSDSGNFDPGLHFQDSETHTQIPAEDAYFEACFAYEEDLAPEHVRHNVRKAVAWLRKRGLSVVEAVYVSTPEQRAACETYSVAPIIAGRVCPDNTDVKEWKMMNVDAQLNKAAFIDEDACAAAAPGEQGDSADYVADAQEQVGASFWDTPRKPKKTAVHLWKPVNARAIQSWGGWNHVMADTYKIMDRLIALPGAVAEDFASNKACRDTPHTSLVVGVSDDGSDEGLMWGEMVKMSRACRLFRARQLGILDAAGDFSLSTVPRQPLPMEPTDIPRGLPTTTRVRVFESETYRNGASCFVEPDACESQSQQLLTLEIDLEDEQQRRDPRNKDILAARTQQASSSDVEPEDETKDESSARPEACPYSRQRFPSAVPTSVSAGRAAAKALQPSGSCRRVQFSSQVGYKFIGPSSTSTSGFDERAAASAAPESLEAEEAVVEDVQMGDSLDIGFCAGGSDIDVSSSMAVCGGQLGHPVTGSQNFAARSQTALSGPAFPAHGSGPIPICAGFCRSFWLCECVFDCSCCSASTCSIVSAKCRDGARGDFWIFFRIRPGAPRQPTAAEESGGGLRAALNSESSGAGSSILQQQDASRASLAAPRASPDDPSLAAPRASPVAPVDPDAGGPESSGSISYETLLFLQTTALLHSVLVIRLVCQMHQQDLVVGLSALLCKYLCQRWIGGWTSILGSIVFACEHWYKIPLPAWIELRWMSSIPFIEGLLAARQQVEARLLGQDEAAFTKAHNPRDETKGHWGRARSAVGSPFFWNLIKAIRAPLDLLQTLSARLEKVTKIAASRIRIADYVRNCERLAAQVVEWECGLRGHIMATAKKPELQKLGVVIRMILFRDLWRRHRPYRCFPWLLVALLSEHKVKRQKVALLLLKIDVELLDEFSIWVRVNFMGALAVVAFGGKVSDGLHAVLATFVWAADPSASKCESKHNYISQARKQCNDRANCDRLATRAFLMGSKLFCDFDEFRETWEMFHDETDRRRVAARERAVDLQAPALASGRSGSAKASRKRREEVRGFVEVTRGPKQSYAHRDRKRKRSAAEAGIGLETDSPEADLPDADFLREMDPSNPQLTKVEASSMAPRNFVLHPEDEGDAMFGGRSQTLRRARAVFCFEREQGPQALKFINAPVAGSKDDADHLTLTKSHQLVLAASGAPACGKYINIFEMELQLGDVFRISAPTGKQKLCDEGPRCPRLLLFAKPGKSPKVQHLSQFCCPALEWPSPELLQQCIGAEELRTFSNRKEWWSCSWASQSSFSGVIERAIERRGCKASAPLKLDVVRTPKFMSYHKETQTLLLHIPESSWQEISIIPADVIRSRAPRTPSSSDSKPGAAVGDASSSSAKAGSGGGRGKNAKEGLEKNAGTAGKNAASDAAGRDVFLVEWKDFDAGVMVPEKRTIPELSDISIYFVPQTRQWLAQVPLSWRPRVRGEGLTIDEATTRGTTAESLEPKKVANARRRLVQKICTALSATYVAPSICDENDSQAEVSRFVTSRLNAMTKEDKRINDLEDAHPDDESPRRRSAPCLQLGVGVSREQALALVQLRPHFFILARGLLVVVVDVVELEVVDVVLLLDLVLRLQLLVIVVVRVLLVLRARAAAGYGSCCRGMDEDASAEMERARGAAVRVSGAAICGKFWFL
eukprot:g12778.t1